jgi:hypothetical protein
MQLADIAGIDTPSHQLLKINEKSVMLSRRFDRVNALATSKWRTVAKKVGAGSAEIERMSSAFEHADLRKALTL